MVPIKHNTSRRNPKDEITNKLQYPNKYKNKSKIKTERSKLQIKTVNYDAIQF